MDKILNGLNERQSEATTYDKGNLLVLAGPGAGKTTVLSRRISHILNKSKGEHFKLLALTFTNKAANEMQERIEELVGDEAKRVFVGTYHSFCDDLLRSYGDYIGIPSDFIIYDSTEDYIQLLNSGIRKQLEKELTGDISSAILYNKYKDTMIIEESAPTYYHKIQTLKNKLSFEERTQNHLKTMPDDFKLMYEIYNDELKRSSVLDFPDIIFYVNKLLSEKPFILRQVQRIYKYILIDEGQDTNNSQFELITNLCGDKFNNLFIVADEDQLIFEWNNAKFEYLISLVKKYNAKTIQLYETYRCPSQILNAANNLIKYNKHRIKSKEDLIPIKEDTQQSIEVNCFENQDEEAIFVCNQIKDLNHYKETCVISRNRYILEKIQDELGRLSVPFYIPMGQDRYITREMNLIINLMRLIFNEDDKIHLYYICEYLNLDYSHILDKDDGKTLLQNFIDSCAELYTEKPIVDVLNKFKCEKNKFYNYYTMLKDILIESDNLDDDLSEDIELFEETYIHYCRDRKNEERDLRDFLNYISFSPRDTTKNKGVTLLTAHASKGLEFDYVFLISMNQGIYPDFRAKEGSRALEEERRNCYVSITRAKEKLYISYTKFKQTNYGLRAHNPSQFIEEMKVISNSNVENVSPS